jgi:serine/threonine protein kinase
LFELEIDTEEDVHLQRMFEHSSDIKDDASWCLAYRVMDKLAENSGEIPETLFLHEVSLKSKDAHVASGSSVSMYKGVYHGHSVAIKRLQFGKVEEEIVAQHQNVRYERQLQSDLNLILTIQRFLRKALMRAQLRHPNILELMGIYLEWELPCRYPCMIMPWADGGNIVQYITSTDYSPRQKRLSLVIYDRTLSVCVLIEMYSSSILPRDWNIFIDAW